MEAAIEEVSFYDIEGVRFYPTDEELIHLLEAKRLDPVFSVQMIPETNIYQYEPPQLFERRLTGHGEKWCNFYSAPDYMKDSSGRLKQLTETGYCQDSVKRSTKNGYWKVTGKIRFIKAKRSKQEIGLKRTLVFYERFPGSREIRTNWVMREFVIRYHPSFKKDFVLCRIKRKQEEKLRISTKNVGRPVKKSRVSMNKEAQPSHNLAVNDGIRNHVVENTSPESQCDSISSRNHVAENNSPELQLPSCDSTSNSGHHVVEAPEYTLPVGPLPHAKLSAHYGCSQLEQTSFFSLQSPIHSKLQPRPSCHSISNSGQQAAETAEYTSPVDPLPHAKLSAHNGCSQLEQTSFFSLQSPIHSKLQPRPSGHLISNSGQQASETAEYTSPVDPLPLAKPSALNACSELDQTCFSALLSSIRPEQGSPYSNVPNRDYDVLHSPLGFEREDNFIFNPGQQNIIFNPQWAVRVECHGEETGNSASPLYLNSSKSSRGFCGGDISDVDTETFISCVSNIFQY